uniref:Ceramide synthase 1 n=1 Tax=Podarcis muralis TaxID=64176 RepID=A0A670KA21_PODMU
MASSYKKGDSDSKNRKNFLTVRAVQQWNTIPQELVTLLPWRFLSRGWMAICQGCFSWKRGMEVPPDIAIAYLMQGSFYGHSIYATFYMDAWRRDSIVMLVHHVVALMLITFSYMFRYHNVGILVLFLHDISDVQLEFTKLNVYFKYRGGVYHRLNDLISNAGCVSFSVSWFWFRLYWFPLKVLYATCHTSLQTVPDIPFYFFFNALLFVLTLMNIYWFLVSSEPHHRLALQEELGASS